VWGEDLYAPSAAVANKFFPSANTFGAATGLNFPDALSGGVFMGSSGHAGPVLLVEPSLPLPPSIDGFLGSDAHITSGYLFGGPLAVGNDVQGALYYRGGGVHPKPYWARTAVVVSARP
jgi:hypothetical protein